MVLPVFKGQVPARAVSGTVTSFTVDTSDPLREGIPVSVGDWMVVVFQSGSDLAGSHKPQPPAGWSTLVPYQQVGGGTTTIGIYAKIRESGDPTAYPWEQVRSSSAIKYSLFWGSGGKPISDWIIGSFQPRASNATNLTAKAQSVTTTTADSLAVAIYAERTVATETLEQITINNGFTQNYYVLAETALGVATKPMPTPGAVGDMTVTYPNTHANNAFAGMVAIPASVAGAAKIGMPVKLSNGDTLEDAWLQVVTPEGLITPKGIRTVNKGYDGVYDMLELDRFFMAHRGGSRDFPEMSLYAYGQAALLGYGAMEISVSRTSDGVWFGLHDESIDRTSGVVSGKLARNMTWAEIQQYQILGSIPANNKTQPNRPYMRLEEVFELYGSSHVLFVDPKNSNTSADYRDLFDTLEAMPSSNSGKFVIKYYGVTSLIADMASDRGFYTWGFFYESDLPVLPTYAEKWSILGMDYAASQSAWDTILGYGKPVIGHVCTTQADVDMAFAKGATGVQVASIKSIPPK